MIWGVNRRIVLELKLVLKARQKLLELKFLKFFRTYNNYLNVETINTLVFIKSENKFILAKKIP